MLSETCRNLYVSIVFSREICPLNLQYGIFSKNYTETLLRGFQIFIDFTLNNQELQRLSANLDWNTGIFRPHISN